MDTSTFAATLGFGGYNVEMFYPQSKSKPGKNTLQLGSIDFALDKKENNTYSDDTSSDNTSSDGDKYS